MKHSKVSCKICRKCLWKPVFYPQPPTHLQTIKDDREAKKRIEVSSREFCERELSCGPHPEAWVTWPTSHQCTGALRNIGTVSLCPRGHSGWSWAEESGGEAGWSAALMAGQEVEAASNHPALRDTGRGPPVKRGARGPCRVRCRLRGGDFRFPGAEKSGK